MLTNFFKIWNRLTIGEVLILWSALPLFVAVLLFGTFYWVVIRPFRLTYLKWKFRKDNEPLRPADFQFQPVALLPSEDDLEERLERWVSGENDESERNSQMGKTIP